MQGLNTNKKSHVNSLDQNKCSLSLPPQPLNYQVNTASTVSATHVSTEADQQNQRSVWPQTSIEMIILYDLALLEYPSTFSKFIDFKMQGAQLFAFHVHDPEWKYFKSASFIGLSYVLDL